MASGRINRNVPTYCGRLGGKHTSCVLLSKARHTRGRRIVDRPSVTELPGLTSDPIYTADRRGGILMSCGPDRRPFGVLNPSRRPPIAVQVAGFRSAPTGPRSHSVCIAPVYLRASERSCVGSDRRNGIFAFVPDARSYLRASNGCRSPTGPVPRATSHLIRMDSHNLSPSKERAVRHGVTRHAGTGSQRGAAEQQLGACGHVRRKMSRGRRPTGHPTQRTFGPAG